MKLLYSVKVIRSGLPFPLQLFLSSLLWNTANSCVGELNVTDAALFPRRNLPQKLSSYSSTGPRYSTGFRLHAEPSRVFGGIAIQPQKCCDAGQLWATAAGNWTGLRRMCFFRPERTARRKYRPTASWSAQKWSIGPPLFMIKIIKSIKFKFCLLYVDPRYTTDQIRAVTFLPLPLAIIIFYRSAIAQTSATVTR